MTALAERAASLGEVRSVVHTAGLSPVPAPVSAILAVDLLGVALMLEELGKVIASINSVSPGVIATPMGRSELSSDHGAAMKAMIDSSNAGRTGTPADIAAAVDFLLSPAASFISGTDLLVDGGVVAAVRAGHLD